jgi:hypothetical protein
MAPFHSDVERVKDFWEGTTWPLAEWGGDRSVYTAHGTSGVTIEELWDKSLEVVETSV